MSTYVNVGVEPRSMSLTDEDSTDSHWIELD